MQKIKNKWFTNVHGTCLFAIMAVIIFLLSSQYAYSSLPQSFNIQGVLTSSNGVPLNGKYNITFSVYDNLTAGNLLWRSTVLNAATDSNGLYNVLLDGLNLSFADQYYLGIVVQEDSEMQPRINLTTAAYSFRANMTENLNQNNSYSMQNLSLAQRITFSLGGIMENSLSGILSLNNNLSAAGYGNFSSYVIVENRNITAELDEINDTYNLWAYNQSAGSFSQYGVWWYNQSNSAMQWVSDQLYIRKDTQKTTNGSYLYNDTNVIYINETQLNNTIDSRAHNITDDDYYYNQSTAVFNMYDSRWLNNYLNTNIAYINNSNTFSLINNFNTDVNIEGRNITYELDEINETYLKNNTDVGFTHILVNTTNQTVGNSVAEFNGRVYFMENIGVSSAPGTGTSKLTINGNIRQTNNNGLFIEDTVGTARSVIGLGGDDYLTFGDNGGILAFLLQTADTGTTGEYPFSADTGGDVGIGLNGNTWYINPYKLHVNGTINSVGTIISEANINASNDLFVEGINVTNTARLDSLSLNNNTNKVMDRCTLSGGSCTISNTAITASTNIFCTAQELGGTAGALYISARTASINYTVTSTSGTDTSVVACILIGPFGS